jgi:hypothetical protein
MRRFVLEPWLRPWRSAGGGCSGLNRAATRATRCQKSSSAARAPSRPPMVSPWAIATAFIAPELVALTPSTSMRGSWSSRSSTPQVNAPWAPPPWSARLTRFTAALAGLDIREIAAGRVFFGREVIAASTIELFPPLGSTRGWRAMV